MSDTQYYKTITLSQIQAYALEDALVARRDLLAYRMAKVTGTAWVEYDEQRKVIIQVLSLVIA